jgi:hypothetical protein
MKINTAPDLDVPAKRAAALADHQGVASWVDCLMVDELDRLAETPALSEALGWPPQTAAPEALRDGRHDAHPGSEDDHGV